MRSADDITAMWKAWNIKPDQQVSFYCGTGWRASETFMYARAMGDVYKRQALIGLQNLSARFNSAMDIPAQGLCRIPEKRS